MALFIGLVWSTISGKKVQRQRIDQSVRLMAKHKDEENIIFENLYPAMIAETGHLVGRSINNYSVGREQVSKTQV
ncbi:hypothetical protein T02_2356 [Trichinella nativa]|uniref:Uncharacterized protein n=1 Tax=Trichinella nativa TaxID=6335 RepID=A0A0V1L4L0_9BILA|nr:hypothetical protein T02_2356 [Trichinella nativa]